MVPDQRRAFAGPSCTPFPPSGATGRGSRPYARRRASRPPPL